jgi:thiamine biosynthesis lipoprotein
MAAILLCGPCGCGQKKNQHLWFGMDTSFIITVYGKGLVSIKQAFKTLEDETQRLDRLFNDYDSASALSAVSGKPGDTLVLDGEVYNLLASTLELSKQSKGAFHINLHRLKALWGLGTGEKPRIPGEKEIDEVLRPLEWFSKADSGLPVVLLEKNRLVINQQGIHLDLGAIVKGYTADILSGMLDSLGFNSHMVVAGGEVHTRGSKPKGAWRVGVRHPRSSSTSELIAVVELTENWAVSTSGDYERFFEKDGKRYHHIFDPRTGYPAGDFCSVTVLSSSNELTDFLSTSLFILGPEDGKDLLKQHHAEALWIKETADGLCAIITENFKEKIAVLNVPECMEKYL